MKGDILILSNDFADTGGIGITNTNFRIVGPTPPPKAGITTFDVTVKNKEVVDETTEAPMGEEVKVKEEIFEALKTTSASCGGVTVTKFG